jgi:hypothetical protein
MYTSRRLLPGKFGFWHVPFGSSRHNRATTHKLLADATILEQEFHCFKHAG